MPSARLGAPPVRDRSDFSPTCLASCVISAGSSVKPQWRTGCGRARRGRADRAGGRVDREVDARGQRAGGDQRHDGDERFHEHCAVADHARVGLTLEQLRRRARRDQGVESGDRAAGDRDERERKDLAGEHRSRAVGELRQRRHVQRRQRDHDAERQREDDADLHERRQIVARRQQQPHRQHGRREAVDHDRESRASTPLSVNIAARASGCRPPIVPRTARRRSARVPIALASSTRPGRIQRR